MLIGGRSEEWRAPHPRAYETLVRLAASGVIDQGQVDRLLSCWTLLEESDFAHPVLRTVPEHTRAVLIALAAEERTMEAGPEALLAADRG